MAKSLSIIKRGYLVAKSRIGMSQTTIESINKYNSYEIERIRRKHEVSRVEPAQVGSYLRIE